MIWTRDFAWFTYSWENLYNPANKGQVFENAKGNYLRRLIDAWILSVGPIETRWLTRAEKWWK